MEKNKKSSFLDYPLHFIYCLTNKSIWNMNVNSIHKEEIDELISLYIDGGIDSESLNILEQWSKLSEDNTLYVRNRIEISFSAKVAGGNTKFDKDKAYMRFIERKENCLVSEKKKMFVFSSYYRIICRVAALVLILILPLAGYWSGVKTVKETFSDIIVEAPLGARTKLYLPDGTLVWLNSGSKMIYSQGFGVDDRKLKFEGEGYFEVTKNKKLPFEIKTRELNLTVLGTKFNFRNYTEDEEAVVNLIEGKVKLNNELAVSPEMYLYQNEKAILSKNTGKMDKSEMNESNSILWTRNELYFDEILLKDIAVQLSRSFDVNINVADSLKDRRFYGSFKIVGNSIEEVLETISSTGRMKYEFKDNRYLLY